MWDKDNNDGAIELVFLDKAIVGTGTRHRSHLDGNKHGGQAFLSQNICPAAPRTAAELQPFLPGELVRTNRISSCHIVAKSRPQTSRRIRLCRHIFTASRSNNQLIHQADSLILLVRFQTHTAHSDSFYLLLFNFN